MSDRMYVYILRDPRLSTALKNAMYCGITADPKGRLRGHMREARRENPAAVYTWVRALGCEPVLYVLWITDREHAADSERRAIAGLRKLGAALLNGTVGGEGALTAEVIARNAAGMRRAWAKNPEWHARMSKTASERNRRQWTDPTFRAGMRRAQTAQWTPERRARQAEVLRRVNETRRLVKAHRDAA